MSYQNLLLFFYSLLFIHWIGDFVLQSHWMASRKSFDMLALLSHAATYTITLMLGSFLILYILNGPIYNVLIFALVNGVIHFWTDFFTSKVTSYLWKKQQIHDFFVVVGLDQLLHYSVLFVTMIYFF